MKTRKFYSSVLLKVAVFCYGILSAHAEEKLPLTDAKEFVARCLIDTNVFVYNPPADQNPYKDISKADVQQIQQHASRSGAILFLYLNGLPAKFESRRDYKEHGLCQTWYSDGNARSIEHYESGKLLDGTYLNSAGAALSRIKQGTGRKIIFSEALDLQRETVRGFVEYVHGVKDGIEVYYSDYDKKLKSSEAHYKNGRLDGAKILWMPTGEKNSEECYKDGVQHGRSTCWYKNGQVQSTVEYVEGERKGSWIRYYDTGVNAEEVSTNEIAKWYPSGQLMIRKTFCSGGNVVDGLSFDALGNQNGCVTNRDGILIEGEEVDRYGYYRLLVFNHGRPFQSILLPRPAVSYNYGSTNLSLTLNIEAHDKDIDNLSLSVLIPKGCHSQGEHTFIADQLKSGNSTNYGPVIIMSPESIDKWAGKILIDVQAVVEGHSVRYQHNLIDNISTKTEFVENKRQEKKAVPRQESPLYIGRKRHAPVVEGKPFLPYDQAADYWRLGDTTWVLYRSPATLLISTDRGQTWRIARNDFNYQPRGLYVQAENNVIVWGTKPTSNVTLGIAYRVEESLDGCKSWMPLKVPKVDFMLGITGNNDVLMMSGIRIPKDGIPPDKDWFELPHIVFLSQDRTNYSETVGPSFFDIESIKITSVAPNKKSRAFLAVSSWLDTSYAIYLAEATDDVPMPWLHPHASGEFVWSDNSCILALKCGAYFIAYADLSTRERGQVDYPYENGASQKQKTELYEMDKMIKNLLDTNKK